MNQLSNLQLFEIFKDCKKSSKERDVEDVCSKLDVNSSEKLLSDIKCTLSTKLTKRSVDPKQALQRIIEEIVSLFHRNYAEKAKLDEVSDQQQYHRLSDFILLLQHKKKMFHPLNCILEKQEY